MLALSTNLTNQTVLSLRTGGQVAFGTEPIINPKNLKIEGFYCEDRFDRRRLILLEQDVREHLAQGFVVNDHETLAEPEELVRLQPILKLQFTLIGKPVFSVSKRRLGKVTDYAVDDMSLYVQKLYVGQNLLKTLGSGSLSIDRSQIVEITDRKIIVQEPLKPVKAEARAVA